MWNTLSLVLPVLIPSWRFFQEVAPSPRVQWGLLDDPKGRPEKWHDFRPNPAQVSLGQMLRRLLWNPDRNEVLFVVSCAERLRDNPTQHSLQEIARRIRQDITGGHGTFMQVRLVFVHRKQGKLVDDIVFVSDVLPANP